MRYHLLSIFFDKWNVKNYNTWQKYFQLNRKTTPNFDHRMGKNIEIINPPGNNMTYFTHHTLH